MRFAVLFAVAMGVVSSQAQAEDPFPPIDNPVVERECSDCHQVYRPEMLTQKAWRTLMDNLGDHFGENAMLGDATRQQVLDYHLANAADVTDYEDADRFLRGVDPDNPPLRITDTQRWRRKHDRIMDDVFKRDNVKFKGNCVACHQDAVKKGDYDSVAKNLMYTWAE